MCANVLPDLCGLEPRGRGAVFSRMRPSPRNRFHFLRPWSEKPSTMGTPALATTCSSQLGCCGFMSYLQILSLSLSLFFPSVVRLGNLQFYLSGDGVTLICLGIGCWAGLVAQTVNDLPAVWFDPLIGKIPWRRIWQPTPVFSPGEFPWTEEPGGLQSMGPRRVRRDRTPDTFTFTARS